MSGKGSKPRPLSVDQKTFDNNWDAIFKQSEETVIDEIAKLSAEVTMIENDKPLTDEK
jgi:hypothetical protein